MQKNTTAQCYLQCLKRTLAYLLQGMSGEIIGPTLPSIRTRTGLSYEQLSQALACKSIGMLPYSGYTHPGIEQVCHKRKSILIEYYHRQGYLWALSDAASSTRIYSLTLTRQSAQCCCSVGLPALLWAYQPLWRWSLRHRQSMDSPRASLETVCTVYPIRELKITCMNSLTQYNPHDA